MAIQMLLKVASTLIFLPFETDDYEDEQIHVSPVNLVYLESSLLSFSAIPNFLFPGLFFVLYIKRNQKL